MDREAFMQQGLAESTAAPRLSPAARRRQLREKVIAGFVSLMAFTGVAALVLIIIFVAKEALSLFLEAEAREEASLSKMFLPQVVRAGKPAALVWQPVSKIPKVSMIPLFIGISLVIFLVIQAAPGGPEMTLLSSGRFVDENGQYMIDSFIGDPFDQTPGYGVEK